MLDRIHFQWYRESELLLFFESIVKNENVRTPMSDVRARLLCSEVRGRSAAVPIFRINLWAEICCTTYHALNETQRPMLESFDVD